MVGGWRVGREKTWRCLFSACHTQVGSGPWEAPPGEEGSPVSGQPQAPHDLGYSFILSAPLQAWQVLTSLGSLWACVAASGRCLTGAALCLVPRRFFASVGGWSPDSHDWTPGLALTVIEMSPTWGTSESGVGGEGLVWGLPGGGGGGPFL